MTKKPATVRRKRPSRSSNASANLSSEQWDSPAGFCALEVRRATLREVVDPHTPTKNLPELSTTEVYDLAAARLKLLPDDFQVAIMGFGLIDKHRALAEVQARTELGKHIAILQIKNLQRLVRLASKKMTAGRKQ